MQNQIGFLPLKFLKVHDVMNTSPRSHGSCLALAEQCLCRGKWWLPCLIAWEHFTIPGVTRGSATEEHRLRDSYLSSDVRISGGSKEKIKT